MAMKFIFFFSVLLLESVGGYGQNQHNLVQFESMQIHLGKVDQGETANGEFRFKNTSNEIVQIDLVSTCECTDASWTRREIKPGENGSISFVFDSSKKPQVEPIDVDVYFLNVDPKTGNPISYYLQYTFEY